MPTLILFNIFGDSIFGILLLCKDAQVIWPPNRTNYDFKLGGVGALPFFNNFKYTYINNNFSSRAKIYVKYCMSVELYYIIRQIRKVRGYSQTYVAERLDVNQKAYSKIELGKTQLNWDKLNKISEILSVSVFELIDSTRSLNETT